MISNTTIASKSTTNMNANNTNKKHGNITMSPNEIGEGKEAESNNKKPKIEACSVHGELLVESSNEELAEVKEETKAHGWDNVVECRNTWIAIKNCTGTCKYFEPTKLQICLVLTKGLSIDSAYLTAGDHDKPCANCNGNISPCFYEDAIKVLTMAAKMHQNKYPYLKNVNLRKFMYDKYFEKELTYLHSMTGLEKLPRIPLPWCFEMAVKKAFPDKTYKGFVRISNNQK